MSTYVITGTTPVTNRSIFIERNVSEQDVDRYVAHWQSCGYTNVTASREGF